MTVWLIRHGQTDANERHLYCGSTDIPLSCAGRKKLRLIHYPAPDAKLFLTSGMLRCNETMEILFPHRSWQVCPDLREINFGAFEMRSYEELKDDPEYQIWLSGDHMVNVPPGGESGATMTGRVMAAFYRITKSGENTVIVTHGGVISAIMGVLFPDENKNWYQWQPEPGGGYRLHLNECFAYEKL